MVANNTYSLDISTSWTNDSAVWNEIPKGRAPILNNEALWPGPTNGTFYMYDGGISGDATFSPPPNEMWEFAPFDALGSWYKVGFSESSNFSALTRVDKAIYASSNELSFALLGTVSSSTTAEIEGGGTFGDGSGNYGVAGLVSMLTIFEFHIARP